MSNMSRDFFSSKRSENLSKSLLDPLSPAEEKLLDDLEKENIELLERYKYLKNSYKNDTKQLTEDREKRKSEIEGNNHLLSGYYSQIQAIQQNMKSKRASLYENLERKKIEQINHIKLEIQENMEFISKISHQIKEKSQIFAQLKKTNSQLRLKTEEATNKIESVGQALKNTVISNKERSIKDIEDHAKNLNEVLKFKEEVENATSEIKKEFKELETQNIELNFKIQEKTTELELRRSKLQELENEMQMSKSNTPDSSMETKIREMKEIYDKKSYKLSILNKIQNLIKKHNPNTMLNKFTFPLKLSLQKFSSKINHYSNRINVLEKKINNLNPLNESMKINKNLPITDIKDLSLSDNPSWLEEEIKELDLESASDSILCVNQIKKMIHELTEQYISLQKKFREINSEAQNFVEAFGVILNSFIEKT